MKHRIKNYLKLGIFIFGISFLLINCNNDESATVTQTKKQKVRSRIQRIGKAEIQKNPIIAKKLNIIKNKRLTSVEGKLVYSSVFDFYIETDEAIYIENEDGVGHSYTFAIIRSEKTTALENLVLSLQEDNTYKMTIVTYHYTAQDRIDLTNGLPVDLENKVTTQTINDQGIITSIFALEVGCIHIAFGYCSWGNHDGDTGYADCTKFVELDGFDFGSGCGGGGYSGPPVGYTGPPNPSGNTNTQTGGNQGGGSYTNTSPIEPPEEFTVEQQIEQCMVSNISQNTVPTTVITQNQLDWLFNGLGVKYKDDVWNFLNTNGCTIENQQFIKDAIDALMSGGKVDFVDKVILNPTFTNNQKVKCVYDKLKGLSSTIFINIINDHFDSPKNAKVIFSVDTITTGEDAQTRFTYNSVLGTTFNIVIDSNFIINASPLEIALTIIHESIHAELLDRCSELGLVSTANFNYNLGEQQIIFNSSPTVFNIQSAIFNQLMVQYGAYTGSSQWNHNFFNVLQYRSQMAQNLLDIHPWLNDINNDFLTNVNTDPFNGNVYTLPELMDYISWIGLEDTQEYQTDISSIPLELTKKVYVQGASRYKYTNNCN